jgi:hypothetical protein
MLSGDFSDVWIPPHKIGGSEHLRMDTPGTKAGQTVQNVVTQKAKDSLQASDWGDWLSKYGPWLLGLGVGLPLLWQMGKGMFGGGGYPGWGGYGGYSGPPSPYVSAFGPNAAAQLAQQSAHAPSYRMG